MKRLLPLALIAALSLPAGATNAQTEIVPDTLTEATGPGEDAARAAFQLREATGRLEDALSKDDQVTALTDMIHAYETGLTALRAGLRQAGIREQEIRTEWEARRADLSKIIGVMTAMEKLA